MSNDSPNKADLNGDGKLDDKELKAMNERWKNRRRMAWIALYAMLIFTTLLFFTIPAEKIKVLSEAITWLYIGCMSIVGFYFGATSWASKK